MELIKKLVKKLFNVCSVYTVIRNADGVVVYSDDPLIPVVVNMPSIWDTVEVDAWSRNYTYIEYKNLCIKQDIAPDTEYAYNAIYQALTTIHAMEFPCEG